MVRPIGLEPITFGSGVIELCQHVDEMHKWWRVGTFVHVFDRLGSVVALTNEQGEVVGRYHYDVWDYRFPQELQAHHNRYGKDLIKVRRYIRDAEVLEDDAADGLL